MKKIIVLAAALTVGLVFSGSVIAEEIMIVGTGSGMQVLRAVGEAFCKDNPGVSVIVPDSIGSGGGIKAVGNDKNKIGRVAREIKDKEKHYGLSYVPIVKMPIVIYVNKGVGIKNLSTKQVCDIYSGKIRNWKDVGGKDAKIKVIRREDGDSSLKVLQAKFPGFSDITLTPKSKTTYSDPKTCEATEEISDSVAFGTYINAKNYKVDILNIDDKSPKNADYPYFGTLALIFKKKNNTGNIKKFVAFATSKSANNAITCEGGLPCN
jgi:phosphate transport system substrate-binding protein